MLRTILISVSLLPLTLPALSAVPRPIYPLCADEPLRSCIEDGNSFWYGGEFMRLQDVYPPTQQACAGGVSKATARLKELLNRGEIAVFRYGVDAEGHTLTRVISQGRDVGEILIAEELAVPSPSNGAWCD
jgi:micrococcal nuclease